MRILHLEDDVCDAELTREQLSTEWSDCTIEVVTSRETFVQQVQTGSYDLILSDFNLAQFNGIDALHIAQKQCPEIPFIFFSGTIGEDRAVEAIRSGAVDYVLKDRPKRLITALKRALENARHLKERRVAEEQLLRAQRLENVGMLAAGIAHDFNNVLAPILIAVPLLRGATDERMREQILTTVEKSVERGAGLVRQILGFTQGVTGEPHLVQPKHLLRDLIAVMRQTFPRSIHIEEAVAAELWPLKVNPTQLHQVLLNLCVNARDAMPNGGTLRLRVNNCQLDEVGAAGVPGARPGPYLSFEIADTGTGIPSALLDRIWEPFFTTKPQGRGTGLGLPTVRGIVDNYKGVIAVHSQAGRGTTFQIYLPAQPSAELAGATETPSAAVRGNGELILVVDDDDSVRDVTSVVLTRHGYRVLAAANGTEAIALFAPRSLEIRMIVTDVGMPELDGCALVQIVRRLNPATRILAISGLHDASDRLRHVAYEGPVLTKPFTSEEMLHAIHDALAGETASR